MEIQFYKHNIGEEDIENVTRALKDIFLTTGEWVTTFEEKLGKHVGASFAVGVMSCTHALELALRAYNIRPGDEVITTPMSFIATANAIEYVGAKPVFVDIEGDTGNINAELIKKAITAKSRAIIPVHLYGQLCDMAQIRSLADKYGLVVIEDAAHALEGGRDGYRVGHFGDMTCYSFYATKSITSGEGGAITLHDREKDEWLRMGRLHGMQKDAAERYKLKKFQHQRMDFLGIKANMSNIQAAMLINQLEKVDERRERREFLARRYENAFESLQGIELLKQYPNAVSGRHLFVVKVDSERRDELILRLGEAGIGAAANYLPIHLMGYYRKKYGFKEGDYPLAEDFGARVLSLPLYPKLREDEQDYVIETLGGFFKYSAF